MGEVQKGLIVLFPRYHHLILQYDGQGGYVLYVLVRSRKPVSRSDA